MEDKESGVMDCLLEALKTGTAFSRDGRKKKNTRLAGGNLISLTVIGYQYFEHVELFQSIIKICDNFS